jgi:hypothetical protein
MIVGPGSVPRTILPKNVNEIGRPSDEEDEHDPVNEAKHVIHKATVL